MTKVRKFDKLTNRTMTILLTMIGIVEKVRLNDSNKIR
jgi:hypothetical protein